MCKIFNIEIHESILFINREVITRRNYLSRGRGDGYL